MPVTVRTNPDISHIMGDTNEFENLSVGVPGPNIALIPLSVALDGHLQE